ncbi:MAG: hypothetical protein KME20_18260 [Kaiparowitsia implicata GSE-PSE-MK54-09C]|nr:hypothetical protein [Kaiparowitsia implicata GSE-PSE-MK54-09C]
MFTELKAACCFAPAVEIHDSPDDEIASVGEWIANQLTLGLQPEEIRVFVRDRPF